MEVWKSIGPCVVSAWKFGASSPRSGAILVSFGISGGSGWIGEIRVLEYSSKVVNGV